MNTFSVSILKEANDSLLRHLLREDGQEDVCFATYRPSAGSDRTTGIIQQILLPEEGDRIVHGNVEYTSAYVEKAVKLALKRKEGLVLLHSHPSPGWQNMSPDDIESEHRLASTAFGLGGLPLIGMTAGTDGSWSARFWLKNKSKKRSYKRTDCETVRVLSKKLQITFNEHLLRSSIDKETQLRTISAWGLQTQQNISRLRIGIVGLGSVGSMVAEILARTGITNFRLIDFDSVERKNLDKLVNITKRDIGKSKVKAIANAIKRSSSAPKITVIGCEYSICEKEGYMEALDCDILFCCVDRPWPRHVLNYIAYSHGIPVIDGGILVRTNDENTKMLGADWKAQTVGYLRPCLECLRQYSSGDVVMEKEGKLEDAEYIKGLSKDEQKRLEAHENVYMFSTYLASMEVMQFLNLFLVQEAYADIGQHMYHALPGTMDVNKGITCHEHCLFPKMVGQADATGLTIYGKHEVAELARLKRSKKSKIKT